MAPRKQPQKQKPQSPQSPHHNLAAAGLVLRYVRDELQDLPASLESAASHLPPDHPDALELRDLSGAVRTVRLAVARAAIRFEEALHGP